MTLAPDMSIRLRAAWAAWLRQNWDLLSNAGALFGATAVTSLVGLAFWAVAARLFPERAVGYGSAAISAMSLLGTIGMLGLGTVLIGELPRRSPRAGLVSAALLASGLGSLLLGAVFSMTAPLLSTSMSGVTGTVGEAALFTVGWA